MHIAQCAGRVFFLLYLVVHKKIQIVLTSSRIEAMQASGNGGLYVVQFIGKLTRSENSVNNFILIIANNYYENDC